MTGTLTNRSSRRSLLVIFLMMLASNVLAPPLVAAPSDEDAERPLMIWSGGPREKLISEADKLYRTVRRSLDDLQSRLENGRLQSANMEMIGNTSVAAQQLYRIAQQLQYAGEPAGVDYLLRAQDLQAGVSAIITAFKDLPGVSQQIGSQYVALKQLATKRALGIPKIERFAEQKNWDAAEAALYDALDNITVHAIWYGSSQRIPLYKPFQQLQSSLELTLRTMRQEEAAERLLQERETGKPDFADLARRVREAAASLRNEATVMWDNQALTGPQVLQHALDEWSTIQLAMLRVRSIDWARGVTENQQPPSALDELLADHERFSNEIIRGLAELIESDASRATDHDADALYVNYLAVLAPMCAAVSTDDLATGVSPSLLKLMSKSPEFAAQVEAYRVATDDLLRWRQRIAEAQARVASASYTPVAEKMLAAVRSTDTLKGLVDAKEDSTVHARLLGQVPPIMTAATEQIMGQKVVVTNFVGLTGGSRAAISRYADRTYCRLPIPKEFDDQRSRVLSDLMVTAEAPALTLNAAVAVAALERGDFAASGGKVVGIWMEPVLSRFADLPPAAWMLIPPGKIPAEPERMKPLDQMLLRFTVQPDWLQNRYLFVRIEGN